MMAMNAPPAERVVVAIDPGNCTGVAVFVDGVLVFAYASTPAGSLILPPGDILQRASEAHGIVELPRIYPSKGRNRGTKNPQSIVRLAVTLGRWEERLNALGIAFDEVHPRDWKGTVNKDAMCRRIERRLTAAERAVLDALELPDSKRHNVVDAIGLGLHRLGRLGRFTRAPMPVEECAFIKPGRVRRVRAPRKTAPSTANIYRGVTIR